jgi:hypothetical protein
MWAERALGRERPPGPVVTGPAYARAEYVRVLPCWRHATAGFCTLVRTSTELPLGFARLNDFRSPPAPGCRSRAGCAEFHAVRSVRSVCTATAGAAVGGVPCRASRHDEIRASPTVCWPTRLVILGFGSFVSTAVEAGSEGVCGRGSSRTLATSNSAMRNAPIVLK